MSKYFIALSSDKSLWDFKKEIVLIGQWCHDKKDYKHIKYPINNHEQLCKVRDYIDSLYNQYLDGITKYLNNIHQKNYSKEYWELIVGYWLYKFLSFHYEKFLLIQVLLEEYDDISTVGSEVPKFHYTVNCSKEYIDNFNNDEYLLTLYTKLFDFFSINIKKINKSPTKNSHVKSLKYKIKVFLSAVFNKITLANNGKFVFMKSTYFDLKNLLKLKLFSKNHIEVHLFEDYYFDINAEIDEWQRSQLTGFLPRDDEFKQYITKIMYEEIPKCYIEGLNEIAALSLKSFPLKQPDAIISTTSWHYHEPFKLWSSNCKLTGTKLIGMQHGGNYGVVFRHYNEEYERKVTDKYLTWGWSNNSSLIPFGSTKFLNYKESKSDDRILYVMTSKPKEFTDFRFLPPAFNAYIAQQRAFLTHVSQDILPHIEIRPYNSSDKEMFINQWKEFNENVIVENWNIKLIDSLKNCKLYITDHIMTTYLESLKMNIPTIIFIDEIFPDGKLRDEVRSDFEKLHEVGIFYYSAQEAAEAVNVYYNNIEDWWYSKQLQQTRKAFCNKYAYTNENLITSFDSMIMEVTG